MGKPQLELNKDPLHKLPKDPRDFRVGEVFILPSLDELPADFTLGEPRIKIQTKDFCTSFASVGVREYQEGVELNPWWNFAKSKELTGDLEELGQNLRDICKTHTKFGAVEMTDCSLGTPPQADSNEGLRDIKNWPDLVDKAKKHKAQSYFSVQGPYDPFDDIRAFIWKFRNEKRAVILGVRFDWNRGQKVIETFTEQGFGHALYCIGWKTLNLKPYLVVVNSYGRETGEGGTHYFSREVINKYAGDYGAFAFLDMPSEAIKDAISKGIKEGDDWADVAWKTFWFAIKNLFESIFFTKQEKIDTTVKLTENLLNKISKSTPVPNPAEPPLKEVAGIKYKYSYTWCGGPLEKRKEMFVLAKKICKEEGLSERLTEDMLLTIYGESGFNHECVNNNNPGRKSVDYGIAQFNSATYLKEYKMSPQEAIDNPEKCLRIMANNFKSIRRTNWFAYKAKGETEEQARARRLKYLPKLKELI